MHILNLGVLQTLVADAIIWMALDHNLFGGDGDEMNPKLQLAYNSFKAWLKASKLSCSQRRFTVSSLHIKPDNFPWISAKAFNCRVLLAWCADLWLH